MIVRVLIHSLTVTILFGAILFGLAGTLHWLGAQIMLVAFCVGGFIMELSLALIQPALYKERLNRKQHKPPFDRIILPLLNIGLFVWLGAMAWDVRLHGVAQMPVWANIAGAATIFLGLIANITVFRANRFAASIVKIQEGQHVANTGPYRLVRHPMYGITVFTYCAIPFALGSWLGLIGAPVMVLLLAVRVPFEEALLRRELQGYSDYVNKVRYRLVPFIW